MTTPAELFAKLIETSSYYSDDDGFQTYEGFDEALCDTCRYYYNNTSANYEMTIGNADAETRSFLRYSTHLRNMLMEYEKDTDAFYKNLYETNGYDRNIKQQIWWIGYKFRKEVGDRFTIDIMQDVIKHQREPESEEEEK